MVLEINAIVPANNERLESMFETSFEFKIDHQRAAYLESDEFLGRTLQKIEIFASKAFGSEF